ncbi:hypothetical protein P8898_19945 [Bacillus haynesii]|nr:hypothetical protein [Bacillus haynesii]
MFKKSVAMFLGFVLIFSMIPYASAVEGKDKYVVAKEVILKTQEDFIQSMKKLSPKNDDEADEFSTQYFKDNPVNEEHLINFYKKEKTVLPNATSGDTIDIDNYILSNIDEGNFSEHDLGNGIKLVLTDSPTYFITSVSETPIVENKFQVKARTKEHKLVYRAKNMFGIELFKVHNAAYFTYGGKSPRAHQTSAYYKRGTTSLWRVENWKKEPEVFQAIKRKPMPKEIFLQDSHSRALILLCRNGISQTQSLVITKEKLKEAGG